MRKQRAHDGMIRAKLTGEGVLSAKRGGNQNHSVRFWIITMMLVLLFGLSTLKLR